MNFGDIIGHDNIKEHLQSAIRLDKISHAYIINGPQGSGKNIIARVFARTLQCEAGGVEPCDKCHSCIQALSGSNPDIISITHEKPTSIGVNDIRDQLVADMQIRPYSNRYKIYIMDDADKMTIQAQNALLKTIEEPPGYGMIILLTENADGLLPTILSRCVRLELNPVDDASIKRYLVAKHQVSQEEAGFATAFAQGCVGRAEDIIGSEEFNDLKEQAFHIIKYAQDMTIGELVAAVRAIAAHKANVDDFLDLLAMWYRDVLLFKSTNDANLLIFKGELNTIRKQASLSSYEGLGRILEGLSKAKVRLRANVSFDLAMELLFLTIREN